MYARFAASFHCACHTSSVVFSTVPISTSLLRCLRYCFLLTKNCMHNEVWGCTETLPKLTLLQPQKRPISIPQKVKFPHGPILHYVFSSSIEKTMTKAIPCDWETDLFYNRMGLCGKFTPQNAMAKERKKTSEKSVKLSNCA